MPNIDKETHFVMKNGEAIFPKVAKGGLLAWYDTKGKHNPDQYKDTLLDYSGNLRHAKLHNFAYEERSGYLDTSEGGLLFDDVDDKLIMPSVQSEIKYTSASRNLFDVSKGVILGVYHAPSGTHVSSETSSLANFLIPVTKGKSYVWGKSNLYNIIIMTFDEDKKPIERFVTYGTLSRKFNDNVAFVQISSFQCNYDFSDFMFEEGIAPTYYVPYVPLPVMTYQYNGNILSFEEDGTIKRVHDGKVVSRKGVNLLRNGNFSNGQTGWFSIYGYLKNDGNEMVYRLTDKSNPASRLETARNSANSNICTNTHKYYVSGEIKAPRTSLTNLQLTDTNSESINISPNKWNKLEHIFTATSSVGSPFRFYHRSSEYKIGEEWRYRNIQIIDLTEAYGSGNEPDLTYIQEHPEEFAWLPNPNDLIETCEIKNNLVGDLEELHGTGDKTEVLSGTEIFTDKADEDSIVHVEVDGQSVGGGSGKNLYNKDYLIKDSYISPTGVLTSASTFEATPFIPVKPDTDYYLNIGASNPAYSVWFDNDKKFISRAGTRNIKSPINAGFIRFSVEKGIDEELRNLFQLEEGTVPTAYEPPAPTPDYPIAINSLNDVDIVSSVGKENLLKNSSFEEWVGDTPKDWTKTANVTLSKSEGFGSGNAVRFTSTSGGNNGANRLTIGNVIRSNQQYTISFDIKRVSGTGLLGGVIDGHGSFTINNTDSQEWRRVSYSLTTLATAKSHFNLITLTPNDVFDIDNIKLEEGLSNTPYSVAPEDTTYDTKYTTIYKTNISLNEPLRSVGDVTDRLFRDSDGLWKVERNVGKVSLTGSESRIDLTHSTTKDVLYITIAVPYLNALNTLNMKSSHFSKIKNPYTSTENDIVWVYSDSNQSVVRIRVSGINNQNELRTWLVQQNSLGTPLTVHYPLKELMIETLPTELQTKLNNIQSFRGSNYVYIIDKNESNSYNFKPTLHAKFRKLSWFWSHLLMNQIKIWNRTLTNEELLNEYKINKKRWGI